MPVIATPLITRMQLRLRVGTDPMGNPILRTRSYNNIKPEATDEAIYETGQDLTGLQEYPLEILRRVDEAELWEE